MTREAILAELAQINLEAHRFARGGVARTRESEAQRAAMNARKVELEAALPTAPASEVASPHQGEVTAIQTQLGALRTQMETLLSRPKPLTMSAEAAEAGQLRAYAARGEELEGRLAALRAAVPAPAPPTAAGPQSPPPGPSAFPRAVSASGREVAAHMIQQLEGTTVEEVTTESAVRDGTWARNRADVFSRLGLPVPNDQRTAALVGLPDYTRRGGNGLQSPAVQAQLVARGRKIA